MPTIAVPNSSPLKEIVAVRSENAGEIVSVLTPQKRKLRSDMAGVRTTPTSTPMKRKSPRRCITSSPKTPETRNKEDLSEDRLRSRKSPVKKLFDCLNAKQVWDPRENEQMRVVKEALHVSTAPSNIVCREDEQKRVFEFVKTCVEQEKGASLYVCGCPGTGKSLSIEKVKVLLIDWAKEAGLQPPDVLAMNCTSLTNTTEIFSKILGKHQPRKKLNGSTSALQLLQNLYSQKQYPLGSKMMLVIADELDYLITKDRAVLHDLFMLTTLEFSRCILIGIANAIDLADRFLPRLKSLNCKPMVITYRAYSKDQILAILQERLKVLPYIVYQPQALELCARKVAAASGDMRKALCVCRSAVDMLETELTESICKLNVALAEGESFNQQIPPPHENNFVRLDLMAVALSKTFKSPTVDTIQALPQHQQIILCSSVKCFRGGKKDTTVGELNKSYFDICKSSLMPPVGNLEFMSMCKALNDQGLVKLGKGREDRSKRVTLKVDESDITFALQLPDVRDTPPVQPLQLTRSKRVFQPMKICESKRNFEAPPFRLKFQHKLGSKILQYQKYT